MKVVQTTQSENTAEGAGSRKKCKGSVFDMLGLSCILDTQVEKGVQVAGNIPELRGKAGPEAIQELRQYFKNKNGGVSI